MSTSTGGGGGTTHSMSLMACVREASPSSQDAVATPRDADRAVIEPKRARRFDPFRGLRRMFRRRGGRSGGAVAPLGVGVGAHAPDVAAPSPEHDTRSRSASELQRADESRRRSGGGGAGGGGGGGGGWSSGGGLSVSHDSVFSASEPRSPSSGDDTRGASASSLSASRGQLVVQAELLDAVRRRRGGGRGSTSDDDEDLGLPRSPPCVSPALHQDPKDRHVTQSRSTCSDGSLLSMGSSEMDEDSLGGHSGHSSKLSLHDKKLSWDQVDATGSELELGVSSNRLSHAAARHKMAVRPKRTHPAPRRVRTTQQLSVVDELAASPDTPDASTSSPASPTSPTPAPRRHPPTAPPSTAINHAVCALKSASLPPGLTLGGELPAHAPSAAALPRSRSSAAARAFAPLGEEEAPPGAGATESFFDRLLSRSGKKRSKEQEERRAAQPRARQRVDPVTLPVEDVKPEASRASVERLESARVVAERIEPARVAVERVEPVRVAAERVEPSRVPVERMEASSATRMQIGYGSPPKPTWPEHYRKSDTKIVEVLAKRMPVEPAEAEDDVDDATAASDSLYISNNSKLAHMLYSEPSSLAPNVGPDSLELTACSLTASSPPQGERLFAKRGARRPTSSGGVTITQTNLAQTDDDAELDGDSLEPDTDPLPGTEEVTEPVSLLAPGEGVTVSISVKTPHVSTATLGVATPAPAPAEASPWESVRATSPAKPQVSLLGMRVKKDSRDEAPAPEKLDNFVVRSLGEVVSPSRLDPSRTQDVFFKADAPRPPGSPTKLVETGKPPRELHSPTKAEAARPPREQESPTRMDVFRVRAMSSPTKVEAASPPREQPSPTKLTAPRSQPRDVPKAPDSGTKSVSPRPLSSPTKLEAARPQEAVFTMDSLRSPSDLGSPTKLDPSRTLDLFADKADAVGRQATSPTQEAVRPEPVAKPRSLSLAAGTPSKPADLGGVGRLPGRLMKQWSSQELDAIQIVEKEAPKPAPVVDKDEGEVVLRRKSRDFARGDEQPELLKVFARRSLKIKDGDLDGDVGVVVAARKDNDANKRDSDKENDGSPRSNRRKLSKEAATEPEVARTPFKFQRSVSVVAPPNNDAVVVNRKESVGDGLVHRRSVPDGSLIAQRWAAANKEPVKEVVIANKPPEVVAVSRVPEVKKMAVKDIIIANKAPEVVAVNRLVEIGVKKMPVKEVIIASKPPEVVAVSRAPEVKKPVEDEVAVKRTDPKIEEVAGEDSVPRFKRIQQRKEEWEQRAQRAAQQTS